MKLGKFAVELVVDAAKGELTISNFIKAMGQLEVATVGEITILAELAKKLEEVIAKTMEHANALNGMHNTYAQNTPALQRWESVARHAGMTAEQTSGIFAELKKNLSAGHETGQFGSLGAMFERLPGLGLLAANKGTKPEDILKYIRENLSSLSKEEQIVVLDKGGLTPMQRVLSKGQYGITDDQFKAWSKESGTLSQDELDKYQKISDLFATIKNFAERIGAIISNWFSKDIIDWMQKEADALKVIADWLDSREGKSVIGHIHGYASLAGKTVSAINHPGDKEKTDKAVFSAVATMGGYFLKQSAAVRAKQEQSVAGNNTFNINNTTHVQGGMHGTPEQQSAATEAAIQRAFEGTFSPVAGQINLGGY